MKSSTATASNVIDLETFRQKRALRLVDEPRGSASAAPSMDGSGPMLGERREGATGSQALAPNMMLWFCWVPVWTPFVG